MAACPNYFTDIHAPKDFYSYLLRLANRAEQEEIIGNHVIFTSFKRVFEASKKESRPHPAVMFYQRTPTGESVVVTKTLLAIMGTQIRTSGIE